MRDSATCLLVVVRIARTPLDAQRNGDVPCWIVPGDNVVQRAAQQHAGAFDRYRAGSNGRLGRLPRRLDSMESRAHSYSACRCGPVHAWGIPELTLTTAS